MSSTEQDAAADADEGEHRNTTDGCACGAPYCMGAVSIEVEQRTISQPNGSTIRLPAHEAKALGLNLPSAPPSSELETLTSHYAALMELIDLIEIETLTSEDRIGAGHARSALTWALSALEEAIQDAERNATARRNPPKPYPSVEMPPAWAAYLAGVRKSLPSGLNWVARGSSDPRNVSAAALTLAEDEMCDHCGAPERFNVLCPECEQLVCTQCARVNCECSPAFVDDPITETITDASAARAEASSWAPPAMPEMTLTCGHCHGAMNDGKHGEIQHGALKIVGCPNIRTGDWIWVDEAPPCACQACAVLGPDACARETASPPGYAALLAEIKADAKEIEI